MQSADGSESITWLPTPFHTYGVGGVPVPPAYLQVGAQMRFESSAAILEKVFGELAKKGHVEGVLRQTPEEHQRNLQGLAAAGVQRPISDTALVFITGLPNDREVVISASTTGGSQGQPGEITGTTFVTFEAPAGKATDLVKRFGSMPNKPPSQEWQARENARVNGNMQQLNAQFQQGTGNINAGTQRIQDMSAQARATQQAQYEQGQKANADRTQGMHDSAMGTAAYVGNKNAVYKWCDASGNVTYTTTTQSPGGTFKRCQ